MERSYLCSYCKDHWPHNSEYRECPLCRECCEMSPAPPMDADLAASRKKQHEFGWWLWDTDRM